MQYLKKFRYVIIQRNFFSKYGEIDIIAKDTRSEEIVFIEVKTRSNCLYGVPAEAINNTKINHIHKTASYYIKIKKLEHKPIRFDAIEVYLLGEKAKIHHIKNII